MAKRIADKELTDRNWDQEEEGEEAGTFSVASEDVLKSRPIKKAKRRNAGTEGESTGAFKVFKGFSLTPTSGTGGGTTAFSGFGNGAGFKGLTSLTNGNSTAPTFSCFSASAASTTNPAPLTFNGPSSAKPASGDVTAKQTNGSAPSPAQSSVSGGGSSGNKEYSRQLTALNCSVRDWITKHVNDNPLCDLNPIFRDYERHLASIEKKYGGGGAAAAGGGAESKAPGEKQGGLLAASGTTTAALPPPSSSSSSSSGSSGSTVATATPALFSFGKDKPETAAPEKATFNFGQKVDSSALGSLGSGSGGAPPSFSFSSSSSPGPGSLFGAAASGSTPFSFSGVRAEAVQPTDENGEEESDEPPKPEVREIKEKDAFYSKKCKLFYKKEAEFKEKGVGTLHLKQTAEGKTQLLVRADTNLGNILLNIMVQASMPCSRMGKNNVMVVCVPNPAVDLKNPTTPVPMLIRVKTTEDADELHNILQEKKA